MVYAEISHSIDDLCSLLSDGEVMANVWEKLMGRPLINYNSDKENNQNLENKLDQFYYSAKQYGVKENRLFSSEDIKAKNMDKINSCFRYLKTLRKVQKERKHDGNKSILNMINANISVNMTQTALQIQQENNYLVDELTKKVRNLEKENYMLKNENKELVDLKEINNECEVLRKKINEIETDKENKYKQLEKEYKELENKYENIKSSGLVKSSDLVKVKGNINSLRDSMNMIKNEVIEKTKNVYFYYYYYFILIL